MKSAVLLSILCCGTLTAAIRQPKFYARRDYRCEFAGGRVAIGDVNGDGIPDVVSVGFGYSISTLLGYGNGTFRTAVTTPNQWQFTYGAALVDLNGDGKMDLVIGGGPSSLEFCTFMPML
jgi:FG-GAP-like repeat